MTKINFFALRFVSVSIAAAALVLAATPVQAQVQSDAQITCIKALAKAESKVAKTQGKEVSGCMKKLAAEKLAACQTAEGCLTGDTKGKFEKAGAKLRSTFNDKCGDETPDYASAEPATVLRAIRYQTNALNADVFGAGIDSTLAIKKADKETAKCQGKVAKSLQKLFDTRLSAYASCKSAGFDTASIVDVSGLAACQSAVASSDAKVAKAQEKLASTLSKSCAPGDQALSFPGNCSGAGDIGACLDAATRCRFCQMTNTLDGTTTDCDLYDDATANSSCNVADGRCNGSSLLCDRAFDEVSYATSHNAFTNANEGWGVPNQTLGMARQLEDGVRSLMLDTYYFEGTTHLCHATCDFNELAKWREPLVDGLVRVKTFLDENPGEIVSFIFESYISEADTAAAMVASGLDSYLHEQDSADPWPTLQDLIDSGKRLVVFTDDGSASLPWHLYVWDYAWETNFSFGSASEFSCDINRGSMANSLFILNHFITTIGGSLAQAKLVNATVLEDRAEQCQAESGRLPNFVTLDFVETGNLYQVVEDLNQVGTCKP